MSARSKWIVAVGVFVAAVLGFAGGRFVERAPGSANSRLSSEPRRVVVEVAPHVGRTDADPAAADLEFEPVATAFKNAAASVKSAVVFIQVTVHEGADESILDRFGDRLFRDRFFPRSVGSGVIISPDGYIVTNHHVVAGARSIQITLPDKRVFDAELVGTDPTTDLAVLKVDERELPNVIVGDSDVVDVGEWVLAVGNPFRLRSTVTAGIVSAIGRDVNIIEDGSGIEDFIQTDAAINPGNSGGALVNLRGELIGINTAIATESGSNEGYGFAVPSNLVTRVVADIIEYGEVQRGYLGVTVRPVSARRAQMAGLPRVTGVEIEDVAYGLAAHRAGLRAGDVVLSINGRDIDEPNQLQSAIARMKPGDTLEIAYWRDEDEHELDVTIQGTADPATGRWLANQRGPEQEGQRSEAAPSPHEMLASIGVLAGPVTDAVERDFGIGSGVYVVDVADDSRAAAAGLRADVVIVSVNDEPVESTESLRAKLAASAGAEVLVEVVRRDGTHFYYSVGVGAE